MPLTFCCICHAETAVDSDRVFAASILTVCPGCAARAHAQRACGVCRGHGWLISTSSEYGTTVKKCDTCDVFVDDFAAATAAKGWPRPSRFSSPWNSKDVHNAADTSACEAFISAVMHDRGIR